MPRHSQLIAVPGGVAIVCSSRRRRFCSAPGCRREATIQCDYPVRRATATRKAKAATCDRWLCEAHSTNVGPDRDYCLPHARAHEDEP